jgi:hypothetical protein
MKWFAKALSAFFLMPSACAPEAEQTSKEAAAQAAADPIDYDKVILLDAESLAEMGIAEAYTELIAEAGDLGVDWLPIEEDWDGKEEGYDGGSNYRVTLGGRTDFVYGNPPSENPWGMATTTFFDIVNRQLVGRPFKFYAINGGNELGAILLTDEEFEAARLYYAGTRDVPYLPNKTPPHHGYPL